jgi:hypothetical protein
MQKRLTCSSAVLAVLVCGVVSVAAQTLVYEFSGVRYAFPSMHAAGVLTNNGSGTLSWAVGAPAGLMAWSTTGSCASGWSEVTAARGRYVVGYQAGATLGGTVGTAFTVDQENRAVGQHTHTATPSITLTNPTHDHGLTDPGHVHGGVQLQGDLAASGGSPFAADMPGANLTAASSGVTIDQSASGAGVTGTASTTINNEGTTANTNMPYVQLMLCSKS